MMNQNQYNNNDAKRNDPSDQLNLDSTFDWNIETIHDRKPKFTNQVHQITYTSRHVRSSNNNNNNSTNRWKWYYGWDLLFNDLLVYVLPTHHATHYYKNYVIFIVLFVIPFVLFVEQIVLNNNEQVLIPMLFSLLLVQHDNNTSIVGTSTAATTKSIDMRFILLIYCASSILVFIYWVYYNRRIIYYLLIGNFPHYMNPYIPSEHAIPMKSNLLRYSSTEYHARRMACSMTLHSNLSNNNNNNDDDQNQNVLCLDSSSTIKWKFRLFNTVDDAFRYIKIQQQQQQQRRSIGLRDNAAVKKEAITKTNNGVTAKDDDWITMTVPSHWTLHPNLQERDHPRYTNIKYPFPQCEPPLVPYPHNPTAIYTTEFTVPWTTTASAINYDEYTIICHGIETAYYIYINDYQYIGFSKDSRLYSEFVIPTSFLKFPTNHSNTKTTTNSITIVVCKWSDGIYVEDQDHWYLSGIHRSIEIVRRPAKADIIDFQIQADDNGHFECSVEYRCNHAAPSTTISSSITSETTKVMQQTSTTASTKRMFIARLYNDRQLSADGDLWEEGQCIWEMKKEIDLQCNDDKVMLHKSMKRKKKTTIGSQKINFSDMVQNIKAWSAEIPNLYTFTISLYENVDNTDTSLSSSSSSSSSLMCVQSESCRVGFRTINIMAPGVVYINHQRIKNFAGMNRHEHDPDTGKVVTVHRMQQDLSLLKQNNFNLVRTSHYPNHPLFYKLTDYFGLYVWDEANIEVHGMKPMGRLAHDYGWRPTFLSRITRTIHRDRNHPSIIFWSLGNEAGRGRNLQEARDIIKILDPSRPVVYEGGGALAEGTGRTELTDIISTMYPILPRTRHLASRPDEDRPVILCEYSHSMGNSNGNLHYYWEAFWDDNLPRLQGGCIWDMIDQGIRVSGSKSNANPSSYFAYGGDFNDPINDAQFCINGMFSPDREPHPAVHEIKYLQQPVKISPCQSNGYELVETGGGARIILNVSPINTNVSVLLRAQNRYTFCDLSHIVWTWELRSNRASDMIRSGRFEVPKDGGRFEICLNEVVTRVRLLERSYLESSRENTYWLNVVGRLKESCSWAEQGHIVVTDQFRMDFRFDEFLSPIKKKQKFSLPTSLETVTKDDSIDILVNTTQLEVEQRLLATIDKATGCIVHYAPDGNNVLSSIDGLVPNFVRAETDNDRGGMELTLDFLLIPSWAQTIWYTLYGYHDCSYASCWKSVGLDASQSQRIVCKRVRVVEQSSPEKVGIVSLCTILAPNGKVELLKVKLHYTFYNNGRVHLSTTVNPLRSLRWVQSLPRIGMKMVLDSSLYRIQYYGRGPYENYPDRKTAAKFGVYNTSPNDMSYNGYIVPSENGSRSDCVYVSFCTENGEGLCIAVPNFDNTSRDNTCSVSASNYSILELQKAKHTCDIPIREDGSHPIHVNIDHALMGLGGDTSWFPGVYDEFLIKPQGEYQYSLWLLPIFKNDDIALVASSVP